MILVFGKKSLLGTKTDKLKEGDDGVDWEVFNR